MIPRYLTVKAVAEALAVSPSLVYKLADNGVLQRVKIGSAVRIEEASVLRYLANQTEQTQEPTEATAIKPPRSAPKKASQKRGFRFFPQDDA